MRRNRLMLRVIVLGIIFIALGGAFYTAFTSDDSLVQEGDHAPDFVLKNLDGETVRLSDYQGQGVFINFWQTFCPPCEWEMPYMESQYQEYNDQDIEILAINIAESNVSASSFKNRKGLTFPILLDQDMNVTRQFGIGPLPSSLFIDQNGIVVQKVEGPMNEQQIKEALEMVLPSS